ncbi:MULTISPECIES: helix-turn-helix domain-containing protein [unclassified Sphingomonas]|uniref:MarR family transcriptional regulator n=1 Tax=unclassified Sphingomonas TaxID=196159 RepID=UPI00226994A2|nr:MULTISPECIES: helix-turn-helix domain-containing protein [unclassified Sphingomonas]
MSRTQSPNGNEPVPSLLQIAEAVHAARQRRATAFPKLVNLMDGPCWDILLSVFIADQRNERLMITTAATRTLASKTTVMRHLELCHELGMVIRLADERDRRKVYLKLSAEATEAMQEYLESVRSDPVLAMKELR